MTATEQGNMLGSSEKLACNPAIAYFEAMDIQAAPGSSEQGSEPAVSSAPSQAQRLAEFQRRLEWLIRNYRFWLQHCGSALTFNGSLMATKQSLNPRAKLKQPSKRVHPEIELLVNVKALQLARERGFESTKLRQADVNAAASEVVEEFRARRGRPADHLLAHHVHALMALYRRTCGTDLVAGFTRNSEYEPHLQGPIGPIILRIFRDVNPAVTMTALANIVIAANRSGVVDGKGFRDFFPLYGAGCDPETGAPIPGPRYRLERFEPIAPIYSS